MPDSNQMAVSGRRAYDFSIPALAPKAPPAPLRISYWSIASLLSLVLFLLCGLLLLPLVGFQTDEVMYVYNWWHPEQALSTIDLRHHQFPAMMMSYLGAFKSWVYAPVLDVFGPSVLAVRLPMLLLGGLTILLTGNLLRRIQGKTAAAIAVVLLSTDVVFLVTAVFDWGPVVIQNFLLVLGLLCLLKWYDTRRHRFAFLTGLIWGLALWNKALFLWNLSGMAVALLLLALPMILRAWNTKAAVLFALGLCVGSYPLLKFNVQTGGSTLKSNAHPEFSSIGAKASFLEHAVDGEVAPAATVDLANSNPDRLGHPFSQTASWITDHLGSAPSSWRFPIGLLLVLCGLAAANRVQRKWILFFLISGVLGWLQAAITPEAGGSIHHTVLFWIPWYAALGLSAGSIAAWRTHFTGPAIASVTALLVLGGALTMAVDYGDLIRHSPTTPWTDADIALTSKLAALGATRVVTADWGIADVIALRSRDQIAVDEQVFNLNGGNFDRDQFEQCKPPSCWVVTHVPGKVMLAQASQTLQRSFKEDGITPTAETVLADTHGTPTFLVFTPVSAKEAAANASERLPPAAVSSQPTLLATPAVIISKGGTGRTTLTWQIPANMFVEVHVDKPDGALFASSKGPASSQTGFWVKNGTQFFLQDVTNGKARNAGNTVARVTIEVRPQ